MMAHERASIVTTPNTYIEHEKDFQFNAPHFFTVRSKDGDFIIDIDFQFGPINEKGVNGIMNEDLLHMTKVRLEGFQNSDFACEENAEALHHINQALVALDKRAQKCQVRGVEGTHVV